jgi:hypothetical protein
MGHAVVSMNRENGTMSHWFQCQPANWLSQIDSPSVWDESLGVSLIQSSSKLLTPITNRRAAKELLGVVLATAAQLPASMRTFLKATNFFREPVQQA